MDDAPGAPARLRELLADRRCELVHEANLADAFRAIERHEFDVVLLDLTLAPANGVETIRAFRSVSPLPLIALTTPEAPRIGVEVLRAGAQDCLVTDHLDGPALWLAIEHSVERSSQHASITALVDRADVAMVVLCDGNVVVINPAGRDQLNLSAGQPTPAWLAARPGERTSHRDAAQIVVELQYQATEWHGQPAQLVIGRDVSVLRERERQLRDQERRFQEMERLHALARVSGGLAHRINNLLVVIRGNAQLLEGETEDPRVGSILSAASEMAGVVEHMLAFAGEQPTRRDGVALNEAVAAVPLHAHLGEDIEVVIDTDHRVGGVQLSPGQLDQILVALARNARTAMGGVGILTITTRAGSRVLLEIADDGSGMDSGTVEQAFEPFFTTDPLSSGLGLSAVHGIVTGVGGAVELDSSIGAGTRVRIWLNPANLEPVDEPETTGGGVVLLAEDDDLVRDLVLRILRREDVQILEAVDGVEALELAEANPFDVLITDMRMPRMGGAELYERLAATRPGLPVVFMSGYTDVALPTSANGDHAVFLQKPFKVRALRGMVQRMLAKTS